MNFPKPDNSMTDEELSAAVWREDALDAIKTGCTRDEYIAMHNPDVRDDAASFYDEVNRP